LSALLAGSSKGQTQIMVLRLVDYLKTSGVTAFFTSLQSEDSQTELNISSIMDTWIVVRNVRFDDNLIRRLHVVKSRGMAHSSQVREMAITSSGVHLFDDSGASRWTATGPGAMAASP
jgi:circadian clock protein KaiC